jgi:hypothetical protein
VAFEMPIAKCGVDRETVALVPELSPYQEGNAQAGQYLLV